MAHLPRAPGPRGLLMVSSHPKWVCDLFIKTILQVCVDIYIYNVYMFIYIYIYVYYMHMYILVALNWIIPNMAIFRLNHQRLGISRVFWHRSSWHRALFFAFTGVPFERGHATNSSPFLRSSQDINSGGFVLKQKNYAKKKNMRSVFDTEIRGWFFWKH